jgi:hypothetical protein
VIDGKDRETVDARLRRLAAATSELAPPSGLAERLAARVLAARSRPRGIAGMVLPFGRPALLAAALAAAASVALAIEVGPAGDDLAAQADDGGWWEL